jgi:hypothetical protein
MTTTARLRAPATILLLALAACDGTPRPATPLPASGSSRGGRPAPAARRVARAGHGPRADFTPEGAAIGPAGGAGWVFRATPWGIGCDGALAALGGAAPVTRDGRVVYPRPELDEWYERGPRGLEQGFTLAAPPPCRRRGASGVVIALGGGLGAAVAEGGREATLHDAAGREVLRYADLRVVDAAGRELPAAIEARGEALAIRFDDTGAAYPVVVDPTMWEQQQELVAPDANGNDSFGGTVALNGDTAVMGAPGHNDQGSAYVFVGAGMSWTLQQELMASDVESGAQFGVQVAVSGDTAFVGAPDQGSTTGAAYVFARSGTTWTQTEELGDPAGVIGDAFGLSVAIDGTTAIVGAPGTQGGAAYVLVDAGGTWAGQAVLGGSGMFMNGGQGYAFGASVAVSGDTAIVGAPSGGIGGAAYVFLRYGTTWSQQQELTPSDAATGNVFGSSVAIDGDTAVVGSYNYTTEQGAAYVFTRSGTTWTQAQELTPTPPLLEFGFSVALSGSTVVVGGNTSGGPPGEVYVFAPSGGSLALQQVLTASDAAPSDGFGNAVAVDGNVVLAGAPGANDEQGAAYVFLQGSTNGDACTAAGDCFSGNCVDGVCCAVASCPAASLCNEAEHCQAGTGECSMTPINTGQTCSVDGGACLQNPTCQNGTCAGLLNLCSPMDACHDFGACDPSSGLCSNPVTPDGKPCPGGTCVAGVCAPSSGSTSTGTGSGGGAGQPASPGGCGCGVQGSPAGGGVGVGLALLLIARASPRMRKTAPRRKARGR